MIYTLTLNPSLDYLLDTSALKMGETNRSTHESLHFGGKGINASYVLKQLGIESVCLGFTAGFTGIELENMLCESGLMTDFVRLPKGSTRINVKINSGEITEINASGPEICENDVEKLFSRLCALKDGDTLVLAGSTPRGFDNLYERIMLKLSDKKIRFVVDTSGKKLVECLRYRPFLVKPNKSELEELSGGSLESLSDILGAAQRLKTAGAVNVLVSMGKNGAVLLDENGSVHIEKGVEITPVSTVGAGDSMVAGFLAGLEKGYGYALRLGNICGAATASCEILADREAIEKLM